MEKLPQDVMLVLQVQFPNNSSTIKVSSAAQEVLFISQTTLKEELEDLLNLSFVLPLDSTESLESLMSMILLVSTWTIHS
jgi:hypothetical protein